VTGTVGAGFLTVWPTGSTQPTASNLNWAAGEVRPNLVTVPVGTGGQVSLFANSPTDVVVDEEGYYAAPTGSSAGGYVAVSPARITDTRAGSGQANAGSTLAAGGTLSVQATGVGGVPATGVAAVVLNATVTNTTASSFLTVWPAGGTMPVVSNLNWVPGWTVPNRVIVPVGTGGKVSFYNKFGSTDLIVDVDGYYTDATASGNLFVAQTPVRVIDTRLQGGTLGANASSTYQVSGFAGVPATGANAVEFNTTVTNTTASSFLTVYPGGSARPTASDLNWVAGQTIPNLVQATLSSTGSVSFYNLTGSTDIVVDLFGYFAQSAGFSVTATPASLAADGTSSSTIVATVTDTTGAPVVGDAVNFTLGAAPCGAFKVGDANPVVTNSSGQATIHYIVSTTTGSCVITAREANKAQVASVTVTQTTRPNTVTIAPKTVTLAATGTTNQTFTVTVTNPATGANVSGDTVNFVGSGTCGSLSPGSATTNSVGQAATVYFSSTSYGFCTITATETATSGSDTAVVTQNQSPVPGNQPYAVGVTPSPQNVGAGQTQTFTAKVTNAIVPPASNVVSGDPVMFTVSGANCGSVSPTTATTDVNGNAATTYTASSTVGATCTITAVEAATSKSGFATANQVTPPNTIAAVASPSTIASGGSTSATITASVTGPSGAPVSGDVVTFAPSGTCGALTSTTATTNSSGQAAVAYISSATSGFCFVKATDSTNSTGSTARIIQTSGAANTVTVSANPASLAAGSTTPSALTITVKTAGGSAVSGDPVHVTLSGAACGSLTGTNPANTGGTGTLTSISYTAGSTVGSCTITATEANGAGSGTTSITQTTPQNTVALSPSATQTIVANGTSNITFTASVTSPAGVAVPSDTVTFSGSGTCGSLNPASASTNSVGNAASVYFSSTTSGFCTIKATEAGTGGSSAGTLVIQTQTPPPTVRVVVVTPVAQNVPAGGTQVYTANVKAGGVNIQGDPVNWTLGAPGANCGTLSGATSPTDGNGNSTVTYTATTTVISPACTITATESQTAQFGSSTINQTKPANTIVVAANPQVLRGDGVSSSTVTITVTDGVTGAPVNADLLTIGKSGTPTAACGTIAATATTNSNGQATVVYITSTTPGFCLITVTDVGPPAGSGSVQIQQTT
jgi:hypothetical protein